MRGENLAVMKLELVSKTEHVRRAILIEILSGRLRPGERLLEARLSKELGVSQATVNAALQDLHNQGLVTKLLNRSTNVNRYSLEDIERIFTVRSLLEPAAAAAIAARRDGRKAPELVARVQAMRQAARSGSLADFCLADYEFHQDMYRLSGNPFLARAAEAIAAAPFAYVLCDHLEALPTDYMSLAEDHRQIVDAIAQGPEEAARVSRIRIDQWLEHSRRALRAAGETAVRNSRKARGGDLVGVVSKGRSR